MKRLIITLIAIISMYSVSAQKYTDTYIKEANKVALDWLDDVNNKQFNNAYDLLTKEVKQQYIKGEWVIFMNDLITEFGALKERIRNSSSFHSSIKDLEDGFYVSVEYSSKYSNTINHTEYLLLKQNDKAKWKIVSFNYNFMKADGSK
jgi:hypothetical protein